MDIYSKIAVRIIESQEAIIGPVAIEQAQRVKNLELDWDNKQASIIGSGSETIDDLVEQYSGLFGKISVAVCREAAANFLSGLPEGQQPKSLA